MEKWKINFLTIWTGQAFSQLSSSILQFAIVWYLTEQTGSALVLSAAMLMGFLPQGVLGPFIGVYIDRYNRKAIMLISDVLIALASLILVVAGSAKELSPTLILFVLLVRSVGSAFHHPCLQAVTPQIVPTQSLVKCAGYSQSLSAVSQLLSPAIAGVLYGIWSLNWIIFLDVIGAAIAVITLSISKIPPLDHKEVGKKPKVIQEAIVGFRILKANKGMLGLVLIGALYSLALMPTSALFPLMSMSYFGGTSSYASITEVAFSVGLLIGGLALSVWGGTKKKVYTIIGSFTLMSGALLCSGMLPPSGFWAFVAMSCLMGISGPFYWGMYSTLLQQGFEAQYMGRIMSLSTSIMVIASPVGLAVSGVFAQVFGVERWFFVAGIITLVAAILCLTIKSVRHLG